MCEAEALKLVLDALPGIILMIGVAWWLAR